MKYSLAISLSFLFCFTTITFAQEAFPTTFGVGLSLTSGTGAIIAYGIHLPIQIGRFRIEPMISYTSNNEVYTSHNEVRTPSNLGDTITASTYDHANSYHSMFIGSGFYLNFRRDDKLKCYAGPFGGVSFSTASSGISVIQSVTSSGNPSTQTGSDNSSIHFINYLIGAACGAEYYFSPHFSFGGEIELVYMLHGERTSDHSHTGTITTYPFLGSYADNTFGETTAAYIRWYF